ncbi:hypothetical protein FOA52_016288 [Chlamydomonas sp. UWO 241]|nr:hypothetical protein FOA52_016288 [Chlamydomonas sp. UWO 241]
MRLQLKGASSGVGRVVARPGVLAMAVRGRAMLPNAPLLRCRPETAPRRMVDCRHGDLAVADTAAAVVPSPTLYAGSKLYAGKKAVVIGAGPAGSTAAMYLARDGFSVDVYERRPEPDADSVDNGRAYIIILIPRGKAALEELGIALPTDPHFLTQGTVRHSAKGKVSVNKEAGNVTWSRSDLAQFLINEARKRYPDSISFHFEKDLASIDLGAKVATVIDTPPLPGTIGSGIAPSPPMQLPYDLLVGADGAASKVRAELQTALPGFTVDVSDSGREYKVYLNLTGDIEPKEFKSNPGATLHLWSAKDDAFMSFTAHRNPDNTYSGTFSMRTGDHANVRSAAQYEEILRTRFAGVPEDWIPSIAAQASSKFASPAGKRIRCSTLAAPSALLLGDAAHAVTPVFGQGANSSLESCRVLGDALKESAGNVDALPAKFDTLRRPDVHGLYEIDCKAFSFFSRKGPFDPDFLQLLAHVILGTILSKVVPFLYGDKPKLLKLGSAPYGEILSAIQRDATTAAWLAAGLLVGVLIKTWQFLMPKAVALMKASAGAA